MSNPQEAMNDPKFDDCAEAMNYHLEKKNRELEKELSEAKGKLARLQDIINRASNQLVCYGMRDDKEHTDDIVKRTMDILETSEGE